MAWTYEFYFLVLFLPLEDKIHIFAPPYNILCKTIFLVRLLKEKDELQRMYGEYEKALKTHKSRYWCTMVNSLSHLLYWDFCLIHLECILYAKTSVLNHFIIDDCCGHWTLKLQCSIKKIFLYTSSTYRPTISPVYYILKQLFTSDLEVNGGGLFPLRFAMRKIPSAAHQHHACSVYS